MTLEGRKAILRGARVVTRLGRMIPQLAVADWVALVFAAVLMAALVAALVVAWIARAHRKSSEKAGSAKGRPVVRRSTSDRAKILDMLPAETGANGERSTAPIPEKRAPNVLDAPASAKAPVLANGTPGYGFALRQPGFFEDPIGRHEQRYWDGSRWTEHVKEQGQRFVDPL